MVAGAVQDMGTRVNADENGIPIEETADLVKPSFDSATIDFNNGHLVFKARSLGSRPIE